MQVVSGPAGREKVHFEAPPAEAVEREMGRFLQWWDKNEVHDGLIRAATAHLWFVTIHPFEDGNGRIARAITDMALARDEATGRRLYSLSSQINRERADYYEVLERTQKRDGDITEWLTWFLEMYERAVSEPHGHIEKALRVAKFWQARSHSELNERQLKVVKRLLESEPEGFEGGMTNRKYVALTGTSRETAKRDLSDMEEKGILSKSSSRGRSVSYFVNIGGDISSENPEKKVAVVHEHSRHIPVSKRNPTGVTIAHQHLRKLPGTYLGPEEIAEIYRTYDRTKLKYPTSGKLPKYKDADRFDDLIAVWTDYFNRKFNIDPPLDPDVVKALIGSESSFDADPQGNKKAFGIIQITPGTLKLLQDPEGEAKEFIFDKIRRQDLKDPSVAIPMGIRWLFRKREAAIKSLRRIPTAEEIILSYKGLLRSRSDFKRNSLTKFQELYEMLKGN
jgi:hypothetical protein